MPAPYDYTIQGTNPFMAGLQGYEMAQQQRARAMAIEQQKQAMAAEEQKRIRQAEYQQAQAQLAQNPNATAQDYIRLQGMFPEKAEAIKEMNQQRSDVQLQGDLNIMQKVNSALAAGKNDQAIEYLSIYSSALKNSGREDQAQSIDNIAEMAKEHPEAVKAELYQQLLANWGPEKFAKYYEQQQKMVSGGRAQPVGGGIIIEDPVTKQKKLVTGSFQNGKLTIAGAELPGQLVSRLGQTAEEQMQQEVKTAAQKKTAELSIAAGDKAATQVMNIMQAQQPMDEAITIVEDAIANNKWTGTGPIAKFWPKWTATAANLQSVANRLGLAELSKVTLGAVSEKEMEIVQQASFPKDLSPPDLLQWLKDRKAAQEKIAAVLTDYASYVGKTGKDGIVQTQSDWLNNRAPIFKGQSQASEAKAEQPAGGNRKSQLFNRLMEIQRNKGQ